MFEGTGPYRILAPPPRTASEAWRRHRGAALRCFGYAIATVVAAVVVGRVAAFPYLLLGLFVAGVVAFVGVVQAIRAVVCLSLEPQPGRPGKVGGALLALGLNVFLGLGLLGAMLSLMAFSRGRQLRRFGRVLLPRLQRGTSWAGVPTQVVVPSEVRPALAAQWRENGRTEHASVAAFARLTLDLLALGAPPQLVASAQRDALDEIRHAEACFSLARALDGGTEGPGPFPEAQRARTLSGMRPVALAQLAVDSMIDGALHEGVSARILARLAKVCEEPATRAALLELARDEGRHAAHGWDVVRYCLEEGGRPVASALHGALRALPSQMRSAIPGPARDGAWERYGVHGEALEAEEFSKARVELTKRVQSLTARRALAA